MINQSSSIQSNERVGKINFERRCLNTWISYVYKFLFQIEWYLTNLETQYINRCTRKKSISSERSLQSPPSIGVQVMLVSSVILSLIILYFPFISWINKDCHSLGFELPELSFNETDSVSHQIGVSYSNIKTKLNMFTIQIANGL